MGLLDGIGGAFSGIANAAGNALNGVVHGGDAPPPMPAEPTAPPEAAPPPPQDEASLEHSSFWDSITHAVGDAGHALGDFTHTVGDAIGHAAEATWDATVSAAVTTEHAVEGAANWVGVRVGAAAGRTRDQLAMVFADWQAGVASALSAPEQQDLDLKTPHGKHVHVEQKKRDTAFGTVYHVSIDGIEHKITLGKDVPDAEAKVAQVIKYLADLPPKVEKTVKNVDVFPDADPDDAVYAQMYQTDSFNTAGTGGGGTIRLYHGEVDPGVIYHEAAHNFADEVFGNPDPKKTRTDDASGKAWDDAVKADIDLATKAGKPELEGYPTPYAKQIRDVPPCSDGEDFAEAFKVYLQTSQFDPTALQTFKTNLPNRAKLLDALFGAELAESNAAVQKAAQEEAAAALAAAAAAASTPGAASPTTPPAHA